jgi:hypothetical protein
LRHKSNIFNELNCANEPEREKENYCNQGIKENKENKRKEKEEEKINSNR